MNTILPTAPGGYRTLVYDWEVFPNWFCIVLTDGVKYTTITSDEPQRIAKLPTIINPQTVLAGFNSHSYDDLLMRAILMTPDITPERMHKLSQRIIVDPSDEAKDANFKARFSETPWRYTIDVFQLLNGKGSLKEHACKMGVNDVAETPHSFDLPLPDHGKAGVIAYCKIDAANTAEKLRQCWPLVELRAKLAETFGLGYRVYCSSEQGLAQLTFLTLHRERTGQYTKAVREAAESNPDNLRKEWHALDIVADNIGFVTPEFNDTFDKIMSSRVIAKNDRRTSWAWDAPTLPSDLILNLARVNLQLGVGGLHSLDKPGTFRSDDDMVIVDCDVMSYYPSIIIQNNLYPAQIGYEFVTDMRGLRDRRIAAKKAGDMVTSDAVKILINSTFGKLNDYYSPLRSIPDALRVTVNGQLYLMMLIEQLHLNGAKILSCNTDGVTIVWQRTHVEMFLPGIIDSWQKATGFILEQVAYAIYARRDVNSYVALTDKGKVKLKGSMQHDTGKGDGLVVKRAAVAHILQGQHIGEHVQRVYASEGIKPFLYYQRCKNGGTLFHGQQEIGRLARWYSVDESIGQSIKRRNPAGTFVKIHDSAQLALTITPDLPKPDFTAYTARAHALVNALNGSGDFNDA